MATQIVEVDIADPPESIPVRGDVQHVLVVAMAGGRPVGLRRLPHPHGGLLAARAVIATMDVPARRETTAAHGEAGPVSIVVCTHERPDDLARCLESLSAARERGHEVLVVDNGTTTDRTAAVTRRFGVRCVVEPSLGLNRARNAGLCAASHPIVAYVDDDVSVGRGWPAPLAAAFANPSVGCTTGLVLPLELETEAQEQFELYSQHRRDFCARVYSREAVRPSAAGVVGMGANMAFRRDLVLELGGFDERLGPPKCTRAGDETDMFARVLDAGQLIAYSPEAYVWHRHRRLTREVRSCVFGYGVGVFGVLTKRLFEQRDLGAAITAARWFVGPIVKRARAGLKGHPAPAWNVVLSETAGAALGPWCFGYESWRQGRQQPSAPGSRR